MRERRKSLGDGHYHDKIIEDYRVEYIHLTQLRNGVMLQKLTYLFLILVFGYKGETALTLFLKLIKRHTIRLNRNHFPNFLR